MKKYLFALALVPLLAACSGKEKTSAVTNDTDSAFITQAEEAADSITIPDLTDKGLGEIRIGMSLDSLPVGVINLYDRITEDSTPDATVLTCWLGEDAMFDIYTFDDRTVDLISLRSPKIGVTTGEGSLRLGDSMPALLALKGVSTEFVSMDDGGLWYWKYNGLWFGADPAKCTPRVAQALEQRRTPPSASIIPEDLPIGYIGTGVPF